MITVIALSQAFQILLASNYLWAWLLATRGGFTTNRGKRSMLGFNL